jgi:hypothetical protein
MLLKIVVLFLVAIAVMAMFGRLRLPGPRRGKDLPPKPRKCPDCGAYIVGRGDCACRNR